MSSVARRQRIWRQQVRNTRYPYLFLPSREQGMCRLWWNNQEKKPGNSGWTPTVPYGRWKWRSGRRLASTVSCVSPSRSREGSGSYSAANEPWHITGSSLRSLTVSVLETSPPEIQVFVKDSSGQSKAYAIHPDNSIYDLKKEIKEAGGPDVADQILKFEGQKLWNHRSLSDLQSEDCDTITLIRRGHSSPWVPTIRLLMR